MKVLVTGGAGFIGSHLLERLSLHPELQVTVLDNLSLGDRNNVPPKMEFIQEDILSQHLDKIFADHKFDAVIHLAAQTMVPFSMAHPDIDCKVNLQGLINVLENCRRFKVKKFIFSSSAAVYGDNERVPLQESEPLRPTSFYGITKMTTEHYLRVYHESFGLDTTIFRFANVYGERQGALGEGGVVSIFCKLLAYEKPFTIYGDGEQTRDFVYAGDIASALTAALSLEGFHVINVSTAAETSINDLVSYFAEAAGKKIEAHHVEARKGDIYRSFLANDNLKKYLQFTPVMDLAQGIRRTYAWYQQKHKE